MQLLVRTKAGNPAGLCELGELWTRSPHLALGYLDRAQTEARFGRLAGIPVYRTGDLGRYLPGGQVVVEGRRDNQVNLRGFRIELGRGWKLPWPPIRRFPEAVAHVDAKQRLVAYIVSKTTPKADAQELAQAPAFAAPRLHDSLRHRENSTRFR